MEFEKKRFKRMFPNLASEMSNSENRVAISSVRSDVSAGEVRASGSGSVKRFDNYMPDCVDFIRRCDNEKQAEEIVDFMLKRGEISGEYAQRLRKQLRAKGVRSFGSKKEDDYYSRSE